MKKLKFVISAVIIFALISGMIPTIFAINQAENDFIPSKIVRELIEQREESSKTFLCEDGSYMAVTYSEPVHFKTENGWQEVNNTLALSDSEKYSPVASGCDISLPLNFSADSNITIGKEGRNISFAPISGQKNNDISTVASKTDVEKLASNAIYKDSGSNDNSYSENPEIAKVEKHNEAFTSVNNQRSALIYKNVYSGVDYEYIVSSSNLKENIVLSRKQEEYKFSFEIDMSGLTPVCNENGSIVFTDSEKTVVFSIPAPYMYDMKKEESSAVKMDLEKSEEKYILTITADSNWINSDERVFPVIIDPTYTFPTDSIQNVFVEDLVFANSTRITNELRAGKNLLNLTRTYIKTLLPTTIPYGSVITSAKLTLYKENYYQAPSQSNININACDCSNVSTWNADTVTWNNQPFSNSANGYKGVSGYQITSVSATSDKANYVFELKTVAQKWLNTGTNKGIMLASSNENSKTQVDFYSTRVNTSTQKPKMVISYTAPSISSQQWEPDSFAHTKEINVTCGSDWNVNQVTNQSWVTCVKPSSSPNKFQANVIANNTANSRTATFQVKTGSTVIGIFVVTQQGKGAALSLDKTKIIKDHLASNDSKVEITCNTNWTVTNKPSWVSVSPSSGTGNKLVSITINANNENNTRSGNITIKATSDSNSITKTISLIQLDKVSNYFHINENNNHRNLQSNEYNQALATWAMYLSYTAYNNPDHTPLPAIPGNYMDNVSTPATEVLSALGFNEEHYNYPSDSSGAHVIASRNISLVDNSGNVASKKLVVIDVRGSVSQNDWVNNFATQLIPFVNQFSTLSNTIVNNLTTYCSTYNISNENTIYLVTGHSLGAALANITAANLSAIKGESNVYSYTFATPKVGTNITTNYQNIFNILNRNDYITYVPTSLIPQRLAEFSYWGRHGIDIPVHMTTGNNLIVNHIMSKYYSWMTAQDQNLDYNGISSISDNDVTMDWLPKLLSAKCPVSVNIADENGNYLAYASQDVTYQLNVVDSDVVSWINSDNEKLFFIPYGSNAECVNIEAYDYGSMNLSIQKLDAEENDDIKVYNNVSLYPGKEFTADVSTATDIEDTSLYIVEDGVVVGEVTETSPHFMGITTDLNDIEYPTPIHLTITTDTTVSEINLYNRTRNTTMHLVPNGVYVQSVVNTGDTLVWTIGFYPNLGNDIYDISVKSGDDWYDYENVIEIRCSHS